MELHNRKTNNGRGAGDEPLITLRRVGKSYATPAGLYPALRDIDLEIGAATQRWRAVGVAREPFAGPGAYVPRIFFDRAGHMGMTNSLRLALNKTDADSMNVIKAGLDRNCG